jgi:hypothetical protein
MKPKLKTILRCTRCRTTADITKNPNAFDGWRVNTPEICPGCIDKAMEQREQAAEKQSKRLQAAMALLEGGQA